MWRKCSFNYDLFVFIKSVLFDSIFSIETSFLLCYSTRHYFTIEVSIKMNNIPNYQYVNREGGG